MTAMLREYRPFARRLARVIAAPMAVAIFLAAGSTSAFGQTEEPATQGTEVGAAETAEPVPPDQQATTDLAAVEEALLLSGEEIDALTSRIALYPDPLLELTLQAAIFPLDVVQASRFLAKHAEDPSLEPDLEWDQSVLGLLNYPVVIEAMNDDLDWAEELGHAVVNQLEDVQDSIQQFRAQLYAGGVLITDDKQRVIVGEDVIAILPADPDLIYVPQYDVMAFAPPAEEAASEPAEPEPATEEGAEAAAEPSADATAEPEAETADVEDAATEYAAAAPGTEEAPVYSTAPVYASAPPVAYSNPYPSFWSSAAIFAGGAAVGGLIGYAIGDDDDDDDDDDGGNNWSRDINIEDSNIVINKDDDLLDGRGPRRDGLNKRDAQAELKQRQRQREVQDVRRDRQRQQTTPQVRRDVKPKGTAPARAARADQPQQQAALQQRQPTGKQAAAKPTKRPGEASTKKSAATALSGSKNTSGKQVKAQSRRGSESRAVAKKKAEPQKVSARKGGQGLAKPKNGKQVKKQASRGKESGAGKKLKRG